MFVIDPLEHFECDYYFALNSIFDFFLTNFVFFLFFLFLFHLYLYFFIRSFSLFSNSFFCSFFIGYYNYLLSLIKSQVISLRVLKYFPMFMFLFSFIFFLNFFGLVPNNISLTGHIIVTMYYSFSIFIGIIIIGFLNFRISFFNKFCFPGVPKFVYFFLIVIDILSFIIRPFSLSIRLFANMLAGHTLLSIFSSFGYFIFHNFLLIFFFPIVLCLFIILLEIGVCLIQAYVFVILVSIYLGDVYFISHN